MARKPRLFAPGILYHVIVRGNQRQKTFFKDSDYMGISLNSASDFVPLRPRISLIAAVGDRSEATLEFFHSLRVN